MALWINGLAVGLSSEFFRDQHAVEDSNRAPMIVSLQGYALSSG